jgi:hypothetical protein
MLTSLDLLSAYWPCGQPLREEVPEYPFRDVGYLLRRIIRFDISTQARSLYQLVPRKSL